MDLEVCGDVQLKKKAVASYQPEPPIEPVLLLRSRLTSPTVLFDNSVVIIFFKNYLYYVKFSDFTRRLSRGSVNLDSWGDILRKTF